MRMLCTAKHVFLHMDPIASGGLLHAGISFQSPHETRRFDYRMGPLRKTYETSAEQRDGTAAMIGLGSRVLLWGSTTQSWEEILEYEKTLCRTYILGVYDCRHYVSDFALWATGERTPVWSLGELYSQLR